MTPEFITWAREVKGMRGALPDTPENRQKLQVLQSEFEQSRRSPAPSASVFDDLPETSMSASPAMPATTSMPDEDFSSLVPRPSENALVGFADEESRAAAPAAQPEREPLDYDGLLGVLSVRQLDLQGVPPKTDRDGWKRANGALMQRFVDSSDDLAKFGIVDMATFDVLAREPYDVSRRAVENAKRAIEEGRAPDWDLAVKSAKEQTSETGTTKGVDLATLEKDFGSDSTIYKQAKAHNEGKAQFNMAESLVRDPQAVRSSWAMTQYLGNSDEEGDREQFERGLQNNEMMYRHWSTQRKRGEEVPNIPFVQIITSGPGAMSEQDIANRFEEAAKAKVDILEISRDDKGVVDVVEVPADPAYGKTLVSRLQEKQGRKTPSIEDYRKLANDASAPLEERAFAQIKLYELENPSPSVMDTAFKAAGAVRDFFRGDAQLAELRGKRDRLRKRFFEQAEPTAQVNRFATTSAPVRRLGITDETFEEAAKEIEDLDARIAARQQELEKSRRK